LLDLPSELLFQMLATLPTKSLLRFARTCHYARSLAYSNLHTLSLAIFPSHRSSFKKPPSHPDHDPYKMLIRIHQAWRFDYPTLLSFHNKLIATISHRHACTLQKLELTLWTLSMPIAQALAALPALHHLSIRIETMQYAPRPHRASQRLEEQTSWTHLAASPAFASQLGTLHIDNANLSFSHLATLLAATHHLRALRLARCDVLTSQLETPWLLGAPRAAHTLPHPAPLAAISKMPSLQVLDLQGCRGLDGEVWERWNREVWRVPAFVAPRVSGGLKEVGGGEIEVDPEYL
ncbi:hypothetical protein EJ07DRAFT_51940, partial [Lizonia empirigonia]